MGISSKSKRTRQRTHKRRIYLSKVHLILRKSVYENLQKIVPNCKAIKDSHNFLEKELNSKTYKEEENYEDYLRREPNSGYDFKKIVKEFK